MEQVEAHLLKDVRYVHHNLIVDDLVFLVEAVPVGDPHFDFATVRRQPEPFATEVSAPKRGPTTGAGESPIAEPHIVAGRVLRSAGFTPPSTPIGKRLQEQGTVNVPETAKSAPRSNSRWSLPVHILVPVGAVVSGPHGKLPDLVGFGQSGLHLPDDPQ